jgi:HlyD family secretion protein
MSWLCGIAFMASLFSACTSPATATLSGYVEGEYVLAAPVAIARIVRVAVKRGDRVEKDALLAELDSEDAKLALQQAEARLAEARAQYANMSKGRRPDEINAIEASLAAARAQLREAQLAYNRARDLYSRQITSKAAFDQAEAARAMAQAKVDEITANLETARAGARPDELAAQEQKVAEASAAVNAARWQVEQRRVLAPARGRVSDVLRNRGEIAGPTAPILSFLPEGAIKLKLFAPEGVRAALPPGSRLSVSCDSCPEGLAAVVTYVSDEPEFTPPVIYSVDRRQKLLYLIEARPEQPNSMLQPGLIVDAKATASR